MIHDKNRAFYSVYLLLFSFHSTLIDKNSLYFCKFEMLCVEYAQYDMHIIEFQEELEHENFTGEFKIPQ